jgi:hypothetical protein
MTVLAARRCAFKSNIPTKHDGDSETRHFQGRTVVGLRLQLRHNLPAATSELIARLAGFRCEEIKND